jgi:methyl-accepting chemotaxis protein
MEKTMAKAATRGNKAPQEKLRRLQKTLAAAGERAERCGRAVDQCIEAVKLIDRSSEQIGEIIGVVGEIASQTRLLALNASIEAARAGEHGLGFALIADEVRKMAERSGQAAREIAQLIKQSTQHVQQSVALNRQTGEALKDIFEGASQAPAPAGRKDSARCKRRSRSHPN